MNDYSIHPARYAKGRSIVRCANITGWRSRADALAGAICGERYTGREGGYSMSPSQVKRFEKLYAEGYSANCMNGELIPPTRPE